MSTYQTPGVYVQEVSTLPPSVAEVSTAVPAFFGYTERGPSVARISSLLEFEEHFGGPHCSAYVVSVTADQQVDTVQRKEDPNSSTFLLYHALQHFFENGGGSCYVFSTGHYDTSPLPSSEHFKNALALLEKEDEPTLIVLSDAVLLGADDFYDLCGQALAQCERLKDRFAILDVLATEKEAIMGFRNSLGTQGLKYGAAYHPYVETTLPIAYDEDGVFIEGEGLTSSGESQAFEEIFDSNGIRVRYIGAEDATPKVKITAGSGDPLEVTAQHQVLTIKNVGNAPDARSAQEIVDACVAANVAAQGFTVLVEGTGGGAVETTGSGFRALTATSVARSLASLRDSDTGLYNQIKRRLGQERITLPPSAAMAGVYATVDRQRGVWKAPANVSLSAVIGPSEKITHEQQADLNVDPTGGKSINALRAFTGKGTLVWGARTLAGNDNEWRYISVRRLFNLIEESTQKATAFAVFEPNDATTWLKVKGMVESYLYGLWERGALAGPSPEAAYYVQVGLGKTMTNQDVLEGRMIVEIGVAAVRPAEFIVLRFSHKLQEA